MATTDRRRPADLSDLEKIVDERTKVVAFVHQSNILGTINPVDIITARARAVWRRGARCLSVGPTHAGIGQPARCRLSGLLGHKMLGPSGIGVLWGRYDLLEAMPPFLTGGSMIEEVHLERTTFARPPQRFEAGTPPISQAVGLQAATAYLNDLGMDAVAEHEHRLTAYALEQLQTVDGVTIIGPTTTDGRGGE